MAEAQRERVMHREIGMDLAERVVLDLLESGWSRQSLRKHEAAGPTPCLRRRWPPGRVRLQVAQQACRPRCGHCCLAQAQPSGAQRAAASSASRRWQRRPVQPQPHRAGAGQEEGCGRRQWAPLKGSTYQGRIG